MKIDRDLIKGYLDYITITEPPSQEDPLADLSHFDQAIDDMAGYARDADDLDILRVAMDTVIAAPEGQIAAFEGPLYPYTHTELVRLFEYAYGRIWPDEPLSVPGTELDIEFVSGETAPDH